MQNSVFKALAHPLRRELLSILRSSPEGAGDLADMFDVSWPTVSRHLSVLKEADLVTTERNGNQIRYRLNTSVVQDAASVLLGLAGAGAHLADDDVPTHRPASKPKRSAKTKTSEAKDEGKRT